MAPFLQPECFGILYIMGLGVGDLHHGGQIFVMVEQLMQLDAAFVLPEEGHGKLVFLDQR
jgi:hypothetical protein